MRAALIVRTAGVPGTLATTSFVGAIAEGFTLNGTSACVVGVTANDETWRPEAFGPVATSAPWLNPTAPTRRDRVDAAVLGVHPPSGTFEPSSLSDDDWYHELLMERALLKCSGGEQLVVVVHPRSFSLLGTIERIVRRRGWKLVVLSNEALTDLQIDPLTKDHYIQLVVSGADGIWCVSEYLRDFWRGHGVPGERLFVQPGAVGAAAFHGTGESAEDSAVYLGNLSHAEIDNLLEISTRVASVSTDYHLDVYGDARPERRRELADQIHAQGLEGVVSVKEPVAPTEVPGILRGARLLLLPRSRGDFSTAGFPQKIGDYLASGRPVVTTAVGDIPKYLRDRESAFLVTPDDIGAFVEAVLRAWRDPKTAETVGVAGQAVAREWLQSEAATARVLEFVGRIPWPEPQWGLTKATIAGLAQNVAETISTVRYSKSGHTRAMSAKIAIVKILRLLRLKPPAPGE